MLRNIGLRETAEGLERCNGSFQEEAWECGLWVLRWAEARLRELRGEPVWKRMSLRELTTRTNEFILRVKPPPAAPQPLPGASKGKRKAAGLKRQGEWKTLEEAQAAAQVATCCRARIDGFKGCAQCMGEWFEPFRLRKAPRK